MITRETVTGWLAAGRNPIACSIDKWQEIVDVLREDKVGALSRIDITNNTCALCRVYGNGVDCVGCPVYEHGYGCRESGTPYRRFMRALNDQIETGEIDREQLIVLAELMLDMLRSL